MEDTVCFACGANRASRDNKTLYSLPVHCLTLADLRNENARGIMYHFHSPENRHNRFLASLTQQERAILRTTERPPPYNSCGTTREWSSSVRPSSAPAPCTAASSQADTVSRTAQHQPSQSVESNSLHLPRKQASAHAARTRQQVHLPTAANQQGISCQSKGDVLEVDLLTGQPAAPHICRTQPWRVARVRARALPHSTYGYGEGGKRPQHNSYDFYKYHGFAGQGAKTSWATRTRHH